MTLRTKASLESLSKEEVVKALDLLPHPEGGYFRETWKSTVNVPSPSKKSKLHNDTSAPTNSNPEKTLER